MALKKNITKEEHAKLAEQVKPEYIEDGDGFRLDIDGAEDIGGLKRAKDRESQLRRDAEKALKAAQDQLDSLSADDARKKGDIETLEKSWQAKLDSQKKDYDGQLLKLTNHTTKSLVDNVALSLATKISHTPHLMLPHIRARLQADFEGDEPKTRVLDKDGKASSMTLEELSAEFVANKDFSVIITATKASGSAGKSSQQDGSSAPGYLNIKGPPSIPLSKLTSTQLGAILKEAKTNS